MGVVYKHCKLERLNVEVFDVGPGSVRWRVIESLIERAQKTGEQAWAEFNGTMIKAGPDSRAEDLEREWLEARR